MARRAFWKGYLKVALVNCPVAMSPATSDRDKLRFHTINRGTGNRVESRYVDAETGEPVAEEDEAKGYPLGEDRFVLLEEDEIAGVALESTRTIDIETFVPRDSIGWIWLDQPHYLVPDDKVGEEAFAVIREAMRATKTLGISRLVLYRRERAVMLEPSGKGIILWTLRYGDEVRAAEEYFADLAKAARPDRKELRLVEQLIEKRTEEWSPEMVTDPVQARLSEIVAARRKAARRKAPKPGGAAKATETGKQGNVVSIMDALRRSLDAEKKK